MEAGLNLYSIAAAFPVFVWWLAYNSREDRAIAAEIERSRDIHGHPVISDETVSYWTKNAVYGCGLAIAIGLVILAVSLASSGTVEPIPANRIALVAAVALAVVVIGGLSAGAIVQRHLLYLQKTVARDDH